LRKIRTGEYLCNSTSVKSFADLRHLAPCHRARLYLRRLAPRRRALLALRRRARRPTGSLAPRRRAHRTTARIALRQRASLPPPRSLPPPTSRTHPRALAPSANEIAILIAEMKETLAGWRNGELLPREREGALGHLGICQAQVLFGRTVSPRRGTRSSHPERIQRPRIECSV
jgi:hypothetical protein